jgi:hypothetical protein
MTEETKMEYKKFTGNDVPSYSNTSTGNIHKSQELEPSIESSYEYGRAETIMTLAITMTIHAERPLPTPRTT